MAINLIIITGATASGKTDFVDKNRYKLNNKSKKVAIINGDMGQMYKPLNIGVAKPNLKDEKDPYFMFDIIDKPIYFSAYNYRERTKEICKNLWDKNILPIVVGGSMFYIESLFFTLPDMGNSNLMANNNYTKYFKSLDKNVLWDILNNIDKERALNINKNDEYRLIRALNIYFTTGKIASNFKREFLPISDKILFISINKDRKDLYNSINKRTKEMVENGLINEVTSLDENWKEFLYNKKIIGYKEVIEYINNNKNNKKDLIDAISKNTRNYAKRQLSYINRLKKNLINYNIKNNIIFKEINL